jgi:hypothetical protein
MADVVDSLLNDAVDLYVQVVDYRRIPTSQMLALVSAGIWNYARIWLPSPDSDGIFPYFG